MLFRIPKNNMNDLVEFGEIGINPLRAHKTRGDDDFGLENMRNGPAPEDPGAMDSANSTLESGEAVARYLADMTGQLETMARAARLELLADLPSMARAEADAITHQAHTEPHSPPR